MHEITTHYTPGATLHVRLMLGAAAVGALVPMTEAPAQAGYYTADIPSGLADGDYGLLLMSGSSIVGHVAATVRGGAFVNPALAGDPFEQATATYADGTVGAAIGKLNIGPPDEPVVVVPGAPAEAGLCRVYGYVEGADNRRLVGARVKFVLMPRDKAVASNRLIAGREINLSTNDEGRIVGPGNDPWVDLQRTDLLSAEAAADVYYEVTSAELGVSRKRVELTTALADLRALLLAA